MFQRSSTINWKASHEVVDSPTVWNNPSLKMTLHTVRNRGCVRFPGRKRLLYFQRNKKNENSADENNSCAGNKLFSLLARSCPLISSEAKGKHSARSNIRITRTTNDGTSTFSRFSRRKSGDCGKEESRKYESSPREGEREQKALKSSIWYTNWPADWHLTVRGTKCPRGKKGPEGRFKSQLSLGTHYQRLELW